ncbi:MAG TPA: histidine kinase [candidate division Zixibacteria bacterium]|nr:histidine kinase [candidate division Zixibacteria bacterium]
MSHFDVKHYLRRWTPALGIWTALGLFWATRLYYAYNQDQHVVPWSESILWGLTDFYCWALLSPLVIYLARKLPFSRSSWALPAALHLPISAALALLQLLLFSGVFMLEGGLDYVMQSYDNPNLWTVWSGMIVGKLHSSILVYWGILVATLALDYYNRFRRERIRTAEIESRLARAELAALKMQLHPHFLFNTLNTIASLIREHPAEAERTVVRLADLLRTSLEGAGDTEIPLREELAFIRKYLDIELIRFQDRLTVDYRVADEALDALTPPLILQPVVENAIKHGIAPLEKDGRLTLSGGLQNGSLTLTVEDNGPGLPADWQRRLEERVGLANTRERLRQLYGDKQRFEIEHPTGGGARVRITIPYHTAYSERTEPSS